MTQQLFYLGVVLLVAFLGIQAYRPCIVTPNGKMDEQWFINEAVKGFELIEHSECDNCEKQEAWSWLRARGRTIPKKMCWTMHVTTHYGPYILPFTCKYYDITKEECELDFSKTDIKDKIKWGGKFVITHSDNKSYVAGTTCIFEKENFWWVMTSDPSKKLPPGVREQIRADMTKLGFQPNNIAVENKTSLFIKKLSAHPSNC